MLSFHCIRIAIIAPLDSICCCRKHKEQNIHSKSIRAKTGHVAVALLIALCQMALAQGDADLAAPGLEPFPTTSIGSPTLFQKRPYLRRPERRALRSLQRAGAWQHHRAHLIRSHPLTRTSPSSQPTAHVEAGPHRRALARHHGVAAPNRPDDRRPLLPATTSCPRERGHTDARLYYRARSRRPCLRAQARY